MQDTLNCGKSGRMAANRRPPTDCFHKQRSKPTNSGAKRLKNVNLKIVPSLATGLWLETISLTNLTNQFKSVAALTIEQ